MKPVFYIRQLTSQHAYVKFYEKVDLHLLNENRNQLLGQIKEQIYYQISFSIQISIPLLKI